MCVETQVLRIISDHMNLNWGRVAGVLAGPKREGWFTSESFVALSQNVNPMAPDGFAVYGEESLSTIQGALNLNSSSGNTNRIPDIVGYWNERRLAFILEAKLVYIHDTTIQIQRTLDSLADQLANARLVVPNVPLIGMVFIASSPDRTTGVQSAVTDVNNLLETTLSDADEYRWVGGQPGGILDHLDQVSPPWQSFNCYSTLAISARVRY